MKELSQDWDEVLRSPLGLQPQPPQADDRGGGKRRPANLHATKLPLSLLVSDTDSY